VIFFTYYSPNKMTARPETRPEHGSSSWQKCFLTYSLVSCNPSLSLNATSFGAMNLASVSFAASRGGKGPWKLAHDIMG